MNNPNAPATKKQTWAIFTMTGQDVRDIGLTKLEASDIISGLKEGEEMIYDDKLHLIPKANTGRNWQELFDKADAAGKEAASNKRPTPMIVQERAMPLGDVLGVPDEENPVVKEYEPVADGVCGFAWVNFRPGTHSFCRWLKKHDLARKGYYGGLEMWISDYRQSMELKLAYAQAFAEVINEEIGDDKFSAYAGSRMD